MLDRAELLQLRGLVQAFYRRQRQASLIVAASIAAAFVLTFGGLILLFSVAGSGPEPREDAAPKDKTPPVARAARHRRLRGPASSAAPDPRQSRAAGTRSQPPWTPA